MENVGDPNSLEYFNAFFSSDKAKDFHSASEYIKKGILSGGGSIVIVVVVTARAILRRDFVGFMDYKEEKDRRGLVVTTRQ
ncbi:hypothetical protein M0804_007777 [Polistes exclamans]|nr:hypothetical protein M0804_007777 [Polistes exclamans]